MQSKRIFSGWSVLIVDDDPMSLQLMLDLISFLGANTHLAKNGEEGLRMARELLPDFILSDLSMPIVDGWQMVEAIKSDPELADIPIIALTAHAMVGDREKAIAAGCHNYLSKPIRPDTFEKQLTHLLSDIPELASKLAG